MSSDINEPLAAKERSHASQTIRKAAAGPTSWLTGMCAAVILLTASYTALHKDPLLPASTGIGHMSNEPAGSVNAQTDQNMNDGRQVIFKVDPTLDQREQEQSPAFNIANTQLRGNSGNIVTTMTDSGVRISTFQTRSGSGQSQRAGSQNIGQSLRLAHIPDGRITEQTAFGLLPILGDNGERAVDIYARPWSGARGVRIAIVVGGLGLSQTGSNHAIETLSPDVTLGFAANGNSLSRWMQNARRNGHEILLQIPLEPFNYPDNSPGNGTLEVDADIAQNLEKLHQAMGRITNYTGVANYMGARFLSDRAASEPIMRDIAKRGILFFDDGTTAQSTAEMFANNFGIPFAASDILIDNVVSRQEILKKLDTLERVARANGTAIGVASAFPLTVNIIAEWTNEAKARGIEIVGLSALASQTQATVSKN